MKTGKKTKSKQAGIGESAVRYQSSSAGKDQKISDAASEQTKSQTKLKTQPRHPKKRCGAF